MSKVNGLGTFRARGSALFRKQRLDVVIQLWTANDGMPDICSSQLFCEHFYGFFAA